MKKRYGIIAGILGSVASIFVLATQVIFVFANYVQSNITQEQFVSTLILAVASLFSLIFNVIVSTTAGRGSIGSVIGRLLSIITNTIILYWFIQRIVITIMLYPASLVVPVLFSIALIISICLSSKDIVNILKVKNV